MQCLKVAYDQYARQILSLNVEGDLEKPVFGAGPMPCDVMFIGEAPGAQEVLAGMPFVGKAGKQLDELLEEAGMDRKRIFVSNAVKYRPTKNEGRSNRTPTAKEILFSNSLLLEEIRYAMPKLIVTLGNSPLFAI